jgi:hypothetical protein
MNSRNRDGNPEFENHLLSIKTERQKMIHPNSHPTYNERQQKIIEMIDWTLEKYKTGTNIQKMNEQVIIDNIIEELDKKREISYYSTLISFPLDFVCFFLLKTISRIPLL